jgi:methionine-rich copper-binding protein CopC
MRHGRRLGALWALVLGALWLAARPIAPAEAHAELLAAYPAPGTTLDATPAEIRLTFSERIGPASHLQLFGPQFRAVAGVQSGVDPANPQQLRAFTQPLTPDTYTVEWSAISADGHEVTGSYAFAVRAPAPTTPPRPLGLWIGAALGLAALALIGAGLRLWQRGRASPPANPA